jgi:hypothetical protein
MIQDERWRACHLQRRLRPGWTSLTASLSVAPERPCSASLDGYSSWLTPSADPAFATSAG